LSFPLAISLEFNTISIKMGDIGDFGNFCCF
jgi:hypothetical protein